MHKSFIQNHTDSALGERKLITVSKERNSSNSNSQNPALTFWIMGWYSKGPE